MECNKFNSICYIITPILIILLAIYSGVNWYYMIDTDIKYNCLNDGLLTYNETLCYNRFQLPCCYYGGIYPVAENPCDSSTGITAMQICNNQKYIALYYAYWVYFGISTLILCILITVYLIKNESCDCETGTIPTPVRIV